MFLRFPRVLPIYVVKILKITANNRHAVIYPDKIHVMPKGYKKR